VEKSPLFFREEIRLIKPEATADKNNTLRWALYHLGLYGGP
jgi:hypothetical protein